MLLRITCCLRQLSCRERADPSPLSPLTSLTPHSHSPHHERVTPPHTFAVPCNRPLDMVILLDESGSVNDVEWNQGIDFVEKFVTEINGGGGGSRIGQGTSQIRISLVAWAQQDQQQTIIKFSDAANLNVLLKLLSSNNVRAFRGSRTCTGVAAKFAATSVIAASSGNVRIVLVKRRGAEGGGGGGGEGTTKLALPPRKLLLPSNQYATLSPSLSPAHLDSAAPSFHALLTHDRILTTHIYSHTHNTHSHCRATATTRVAEAPLLCGSLTAPPPELRAAGKAPRPSAASCTTALRARVTRLAATMRWRHCVFARIASCLLASAT